MTSHKRNHMTVLPAPPHPQTPPPRIVALSTTSTTTAAVSLLDAAVSDDYDHTEGWSDDPLLIVGMIAEEGADDQQQQQASRDYNESNNHSSSDRKRFRRLRRDHATALRRVQRVSRQAALSTKKAVWDSNEISLNAALRAVDQWEALYNALRVLVVTGVHHTCRLYDAAKQGAQKMERGVLLPLRDWIVLPAFWCVEGVTRETVAFLQSHHARRLAEQSLFQVQKVPILGDNVLSPALCFCAGFVQRTWEIVQYPIPSKQKVRDTVDFALTGTKWALSTAGREVFLYVRRADANITRTLSHTQWKVLGSGPYATLDKLNKQEVIDHLTERYLSLATTATVNSSVVDSTDHTQQQQDAAAVASSIVARYELAAHIKRHNFPLYRDLVLSGLLRKRGGILTQDDEWLSPCPVYCHQYRQHQRQRQERHHHLDRPFLLPPDSTDYSICGHNETDDVVVDDDVDAPHVTALWFRLPYLNGQRPSRDTPWICFRRSEQYRLEERYLQLLKEAQQASLKQSTNTTNANNTTPGAPARQSHVQVDEHGIPAATDASTNRSLRGEASTAPMTNQHYYHGDGDTDDDDPNRDEDTSTGRHPTVAKWYQPDLRTDVLVDQKRHAVSFLHGCPTCRKPHQQQLLPKTCRDLCDACRELEQQQQIKQQSISTGLANGASNSSSSDVNDSGETSSNSDLIKGSLQPPAISSVMRPTLWRFHGPGDEVRRSTWFLEQNGLQPFDEEAQAILEDAYLFLKWMTIRQEVDAASSASSSSWSLGSSGSPPKSSLDHALLTVEVNAPDGTVRLVQFSSLSQATAIQKGIGAAITIYKRRVYRGAWLQKKRPLEEVFNNHPVEQERQEQNEQIAREISVAESILQAAMENGTMGETMVPNVSLRSIISPPPSPETNRSTDGGIDEQKENRLLLYNGPGNDMAVPPSKLWEGEMAKFLVDEDDSNGIDHLCLIVHGIGEMMRSIDVFGLSLPTFGSIIDCCGYLRRNHADIQDAHYFTHAMNPTLSDNNSDASSHSSSTTTSSSRVEYLPVEWHEAFAILSQRRAASSLPSSNNTGNRGVGREIINDYKKTVMLKDISLRTIPNMREFANDTLMDVLYFMSPEHHDIIVDIVTSEMNVVVEKFRQLTGFTGRISLIGHSLGSIISWDILANQVKHRESDALPAIGSLGSIDTLSTRSDRSVGIEPAIDETLTGSGEGPSHPPQSQQQLSTYPQLDFDVDNFFSLGSPVPVFLMIRNQRKPLSEDFYLNGCRRVFNIFHPYDPGKLLACPQRFVFLLPCLDATSDPLSLFSFVRQWRTVSSHASTREMLTLNQPL
jgi:DDHD domain